MTYEYTTVSTMGSVYMTRLQELGKEGWKLICSVPSLNPDANSLILMREVKPTPLLTEAK